MKQLLYSIQKSIYSPEYYRTLLMQPMRYSLKYFFAFTLLIAVFFTIVTSIPLIISTNRVVHEFPTKFFTYFPDELIITVSNGVVSTNVSEPYFLPVPAEFKTSTSSVEVANIAVIDTQTPFSLTQFDTYNSAVWVGENQIAFRNGQGSVRIEPFNKNLNYTLTEQKLRNFEARVSPYYGFIAPLIVIFIFIALLVGLSVNLLYLLFGALLILVLSKFMKLNLSYGKSYQIGLHAITLAVLIEILLSISSLSILRIPFFPTFMMLLVVYMNYKDLRPLEPNSVPPTLEHTPPLS